VVQKTDVIVSGAALNGLAAALALSGRQARRPLDTIVIDRRDPRDLVSDTQDARASAITASSQRMFEALHIWQAIAPNAQEMHEILVTDADPRNHSRRAILEFGEDDHAGRPSAFMVENRHLYAALIDAAEASPHIKVVANTAITGFDFGPGFASVTCDTGAVCKAPLLVAADGRASPAREAAGIATRGWNYDQSAIVTTVRHELPHEGRAEEHFLPAGPFAILPLTDNRASLVWTERTMDAERIMALDDKAFLDELVVRFGGHLGDVELAGARLSYPLGLSIARSFTGNRLALVGDAAHVIHPIAGLGFNLGLRDAAALAECVADAVKLGQDWGGAAALDRYARWRRFDTALAAVATDGLNRLFSNDNDAVRTLRDLGARAVGSIGAVRGLFMREAAGETGRLPKLLQGEAV
jgi:2-octaprenyl-6-methoxyphenol hydroxylase